MTRVMAGCCQCASGGREAGAGGGVRVKDAHRVPVITSFIKLALSLDILHHRGKNSLFLRTSSGVSGPRPLGRKMTPGKSAGRAGGAAIRRRGPASFPCLPCGTLRPGGRGAALTFRRAVQGSFLRRRGR